MLVRDVITKAEQASLIYPLDFPRTADQRVYHLGLRPGEVANRIVSLCTLESTPLWCVDYTVI
jgi:hypothetical protein